MISLRPWTLVALLALAACSGGEKPKDTEPEKPEETAPPKLDDDATDKDSHTVIPSILETQRALEAAGVDKKLAEQIPEREFKIDENDKDGVAVRTGVIAADTLLTIKTSPDDQLLTSLGHIRDAMKLLQGGDDIDATIADLQDRVKAGGADRDMMLQEVDQLVYALIPELEFNGQDRIVPLIQAGSWLGGANLVAKASKAAGKADAANDLLKRTEVVEYFQKYVKAEGKDIAPAAVTQKLEETLQTLHDLAKKEGSLTDEDLDTIIKSTDDVLALL